MPIGRSLKRAIALVILVALGFAQATVALAACQIDRSGLSQALERSDDCPCLEGQTELTPGCVAHCTADLQLAGVTTVIARAPADAPVLLVARSEPSYASREWRDARPPGGHPARILFQSFLI